MSTAALRAEIERLKDELGYHLSVVHNRTTRIRALQRQLKVGTDDV